MCCCGCACSGLSMQRHVPAWCRSGVMACAAWPNRRSCSPPNPVSCFSNALGSLSHRKAHHLIDHRQTREGAMIHHLSIAAGDPQHVAAVLAEIMGGKAVPFPPNPGSFFALQLDDHGSGVEVYPAGTELRPGGEVG